MFLGLFGIAFGLCLYTAMAYLRTDPPNVNFTGGHASGQPVDLHIQTVGSIGFGPHPTWVSYMVQAPDGSWVHSTLWQVPANTQINVTLDQYDSGSPLRNQQIGRITGVNATLNGKPYTLLDAANGNGAGHTFTMPAKGINIPLKAISGSSNNACSAAPCSHKYDHNVIKFSFNSGHPGQYRWQCFVPCGLATFDGNGGPMQTVGYMDGFVKVVA
ncbi:MAG: hypothetical protein ACRDYD_03040 [Acidimicrobiales bacterium]